MSYVIRYVATAGISLNDFVANPGDYLAHYDPDAMAGAGVAVWTPLEEHAMEFVDVEAATRCYRLVSNARPLRDDGEPNRPLTAYTVEVSERTPR